MINIKSVSKSIGKKIVLNNVSISIPARKITALCGPNGAGKTTLIRLILKLLKPSKGTIDYNLDFNRISFLFHNNCLFPDISLLENYKFFQSSKRMQIDYDLLNYYLHEFYLFNEINSKASTLSQGMLKKANIIRALIEKPVLLILDEPTTELDPVGKIEMRRILKNLVRKNKLTLFYSSHLLDEMEKTADKVLILNEGRVAWAGDLNQDIIKMNESLESKFLSILGIVRRNDSDENK